jgi:prolipoprotein diacylglyceryltransferase
MITLLTITTVQWYGIVLIVAGVICRYVVGRNRFNRRGSGGLQQYDSYNKALATSFFERLLKLAGTVLIVGGIFLYAVEWFNKRSAEKFRQEQMEENAKTKS